MYTARALNVQSTCHARALHVEQIIKSDHFDPVLVKFAVVSGLLRFGDSDCDIIV